MLWGDPYQRDVPAGVLTEGQIESLASDLPATDAQRFRQWAKRIAQGGRMPDEEPAKTVKVALLYQERFEQQAAAALAEQARRDAAAAQARAEREAQLAAQAQDDEMRAQANAAISKVAQVDIVGFQLRPVYGTEGFAIGQQWVFKLSIHNRSPKAISGLRGELFIEDQFREHNFRAEGQINAFVPAKSTAGYEVAIVDDERDPLFQAMRKGARITYEWKLYSAAFEDGTVFDYKQLAQQAGQ